ncbi:MAG: cytochrome c-type biosis protein CcmE-like protein [Bryobacterales bacterium]|jgi:cytochrome c-type biogenesis protein CcmE|nr:cytochrome c-type biosis protein CcmE-like protein [Bryobacterales bacterium]
MKKYAKFGILIAIIVGSIAWVATASIQSSKTYYVTIAELTKMGQQASSKRVRVGGDIQEHSIVRTGNTVRFNLVQESKTLPVVYEGRDPLPDTFKDGAQALAGGRLDDSGVFHAQEVQAKCASKYAPKPGMAPEGLQKKIVNKV